MFFDAGSKHIYLLLVIVLCLTVIPVIAQEAPTAEPVYGGYVEWLDAIALDATTTRVYISTLSANTMLYMDVDHSGGSPVYGTWSTVPDMDWDDGFGGMSRGFDADPTSGFVFHATGQGLYGLDINVGSLYEVEPTTAEDVLVYDDILFYLGMPGGELHLYYRTINSDGSVNTENSVLVSSTYSGGGFRPEIHVNPVNEYVYVFVPGTPPDIYKSSDTYDALSGSTAFSSLSVADLNSTGNDYWATTIAPDGRFFAGGYYGTGPDRATYIGYSDDDGTSWTTFDCADADGGWAPTMSTAGNASNYNVYFGRALSTNNGVSGSWGRYPSTVQGGRVMDGPVAIDPNDSNTIYMRTDWGAGSSDDGGSSIEEINDGLTAVQVHGFAMDVTKNTAWVASKSGIWYVTDYQTSPTWNTVPYWPQYDTTPYSAVAATATADTAYMGNSSLRLFRYESANGAVSNATILEIAGIDTAFTQNSLISAIANDPYSSTERIFAGVYDGEDYGEDEEFGGVMLCEENSPYWDCSKITGGAWPSFGADVNDVVIVQEDGLTVLYVGVEYYYDASAGTARSIYRMEDDGSGNWTITQDMLNDTQNISVTILDLYADSDGNIYACGANTSGHPVIYSKTAGDSVWTVLSSGGSGIPEDVGAKAITVDETTGDVYIAIDHEIYVLTSGASEWTLYYEYPVGTDIQFIYYDELLVGTGTGLYAHQPDVGVDPVNGYLPVQANLVKAYPNPFNGTTRIHYTINNNQRINLSVYNLTGRHVGTIETGFQQKGVYVTQWNAPNLSSGIYLIKLEGSKGVNVSTKVTLIK